MSRLRESGEPLVASMTTIPARIPLVHLAVESILNQSLAPTRFILWISDQIDLQRDLTPRLHELIERGLEIRQVPDVGPHTKLVYAWEEFRDYPIATFDDDLVYPIATLQCLYDAYVRSPTSIVCNWARELSFDRNRGVLGVRRGRLLTPPLLEENVELNRHAREPSLLAFPYGTGGVLYPPNSLDKRVSDVSLAQKLCPKEDDIWFKAMSLLNGTYVLPTSLGITPCHHSVLGTQAVALRHDNHECGEHVVQLTRVFDYFDLYDVLRGSKGKVSRLHPADNSSEIDIG